MTQTAADSYTEKRYDTIDKKSGVVLSLPLLFKDDQYLSVLTNEVKEQMQKIAKKTLISIIGQMMILKMD